MSGPPVSDVARACRIRLVAAFHDPARTVEEKLMLGDLDADAFEVVPEGVAFDPGWNEANVDAAVAQILG